MKKCIYWNRRLNNLLFGLLNKQYLTLQKLNSYLKRNLHLIPQAIYKLIYKLFIWVKISIINLHLF